MIHTIMCFIIAKSFDYCLDAVWCVIPEIVSEWLLFQGVAVVALLRHFGCPCW